MAANGYVATNLAQRKDSLDETAHQSSYIFAPANAESPREQRPSKRRKISKPAPDLVESPIPFTALLNGKESLEAVQLRYVTVQRCWSEQEDKIRSRLQDVDAVSLDEIAGFVSDASPLNYHGRIPVGLVVAGLNISSHKRLFEHLSTRLSVGATGEVIVLEPGQAQNLKTALKTIIRATITQADGSDAYRAFSEDREGPKLLNYDLQLLEEFLDQKKTKKVVIAFRDSEAFDTSLLAELIPLINSWLDRIHFVLLFGIATSVELFEDRLPRSTVRLMQGRRFDIQGSGSSIDDIFQTLEQGENGKVWLGHGVSSMLLERSREYIQSPETFVNSVKYAYMSHFFANPLTILLAEDDCLDSFQVELCEAIRNIPSFRRWSESLLDGGEAKIVLSLLNDDHFLIQEAKSRLILGQETMNKLVQASMAVTAVVPLAKTSGTTRPLDVYLEALSGDLLTSPMLQDLLLSVKKMPSDSLRQLLDIILPDLIPVDELGQLQAELHLLVGDSIAAPLRSAHDTQHSTLQTTVIGQKVKLSKQKAKLSSAETEYTLIVDGVHDSLSKHFSETLINPYDLFLHEVFIYNLKSPTRDAFLPRPRLAIERALSVPFDYLSCECCEEAEGSLSASQPPTAILYQLYLESGSLINVFDLWSAFNAIIGGEDGGRCEERMAFALFYRGLSELRSLGMVKQSRKKIDHLAKMVWKGL